MKKIIIAVDGTSGSGKSSTMERVAQRIDYQIIDTGLMYRALTWLGIQNKIDFTNKLEIINLIDQFNYEIKDNQIFLNTFNITKQLHTNIIISKINFVTVIPEIREFMVQKQREMVSNGGFILIGRDIASVVLPNADLKIFLTSSVKSRAQRRFEQNQELGFNDADLEEIKQAILNRDYSDMNREVGPLLQTKDAWYIDNSYLVLEEVVEMIVKKVKEMEG